MERLTMNQLKGWYKYGGGIGIDQALKWQNATD